MAHILRKYTSNRGSALFMVISTMTALIISCMAMYFTMVSANESQYAVFNQMQATQTSVSLREMVLKSLAPDNADASHGDELLEAMRKLEVGDCISTGANGFMALDPNVESGASQDQLGAYSVTITCLEKNPDTGYMKFDILAMSSVNGSRDAVHFIYDFDPSNPDALLESADGGDMQLFTATGYVPNDAYIDGGYYLTDVFYDTQYTYMNTYGGSGENRIGQSLATGGDLMLGADAMTVVKSHGATSIKDEDVAKIGPVTWAIRGNFYPNFSSDFDMRGGSRILVGGDYVFDGGNTGYSVKNSDYYLGANTLDDHICVYVNGDLNYSGSDIRTNLWFFVNGNVYNVGSNTQSNARLFVTGNDAERAAKTSTLSTSMPIEEWPKEGSSFAYGLTYDEFIKTLGQKTATIAYYKWDLSDNTKGSKAKHVDIRINSTDNDWTDDKGDVYEKGSRNFIFAYPGSSSESLVKVKNDDGTVTGGKETGVIGNSFIIDSVWTPGSNLNPQTIIIDTGDDPNNIMTIKISPQFDIKTEGGKKKGTFSWFVDKPVNVINWYPYEATYGDPGPMLSTINNNEQRLVLLVGRGTVLIDIPDGVTYQDFEGGMTGHIGWWLAQGGKIQTKDDGHLYFTGVKHDAKFSPTIVPYIHKTCEPGDGCSFTLTTITDENAAKCVKCQGDLTQVTCSVHGKVNKFCAECYKDKIDRTDWCTNHVDKLHFKDFYNTLSGAEKDWSTGSAIDGDSIIYPTTNLMLVSCEESAEIRFAKTTTSGYTLTYNNFFGFVYAPYMTYLNSGGSGNQTIKLCGGMTVADYDIQGTDSYIGCYPDHMPTELAQMEGGGSMAGGQLAGVAKSWKINIGGYI